MKQPALSFAVVAAMVLCGLGTSTAGVITFDDIAHGEEATMQINRIAPIGGFGLFDRIEITLGGSGAVDNLVLLPAPGALALRGLGLLAFSRPRERNERLRSRRRTLRAEMRLQVPSRVRACFACDLSG